MDHGPVSRYWTPSMHPLVAPKQLAETLINYCVGMRIETSANAMFRRTTDLFIQQKLKKLRSMLAQTESLAQAYAALAILGNLRGELGVPIPLAWAPAADVSPVAAIEVYPAATLVAHRIRSSGYKKRDQIDERREIVAALRTKLTIDESVPDLALAWTDAAGVGRAYGS